MQTYLEFRFTVTPPQPWSEILMAELMECGFDSFTEEHDGILAYIPKERYDEAELKETPLLNHSEVRVEYSFSEMPNINWNEEWEKNFSPINIENQVQIRAEFHEPDGAPYEIIIQPKMSFGTGHHATTYLMIRQMLDMDFQDKYVLDMGCGTSVLAIFAKMRGAADVLAIDIDEWAVENSTENVLRNGTNVRVKMGDASALGAENFDIILANINRNILISDIPKYVSVLNDGGSLLLSGLCFFDVDDILEVCRENGLTVVRQLQREEWVSILLHK